LKELEDQLKDAMQQNSKLSREYKTLSAVHSEVCGGGMEGVEESCPDNSIHCDGAANESVYIINLLICKGHSEGQ
jgi:hypothetical protein